MAGAADRLRGTQDGDVRRDLSNQDVGHSGRRSQLNIDELRALVDRMEARKKRAATRLEQAHEALRRLPESQRSVFVLYEVNQLRYPEIAATLEIPINTVKVRLLRARQQLTKLLHQEEPWTTLSKD